MILLITILNSMNFTSYNQADSVIYSNSYPSNNYTVNMTIIGELNKGGGAKDIEIVGDVAYVLSDSGLNIYDVADPYNTLELGHYYSDGYLGHSIAVYSDYAFTAADDMGLKIIDIIDPSNPVLANTYTSTRPAAICIQNNLLFVANWENDFEIYDISNVPLITEVIRFEGDGFSYVYANNELCFAFANNGSLIVLDISNPEGIAIIGQIDDEEISCVAIDGNYWYTGGSNGIKGFNSTVQTEPVLMNHYSETELSFITNMVILDGFIFASDYYIGFRIFEISESSNISEIGRDEAGGSPLGFQVDGEMAYVASQIGGIKIIKIQGIEIETNSSTEGMNFGTEFILLSIGILGLFTKRRRSENRKIERKR